mgnify:CR=1 FL=1
MSRVFAIQSPTRRDPHTGLITKVFDFTDAERFGEVVVLIDAELKPTSQDLVRRLLWEQLRNFTEDDYLLLTGNPIIMSQASSMANLVVDGRVSYLQWSGHHKQYIEVRTDLFRDIPDDL